MGAEVRGGGFHGFEGGFEVFHAGCVVGCLYAGLDYEFAVDGLLCDECF